MSCLLLLTAYVFELYTAKNTTKIVVTALSHERSSLCYEERECVLHARTVSEKHKASVIGDNSLA